MNKTEFIEKLSKELNTTKTEANKNFDAVIKCITQAMKDHDELRFTGFGSFKAKQTEAKEVKRQKAQLLKSLHKGE
jgi:nucleoid DNA-binding protein